MDNRELIVKLNNLKTINPDSAWLANNRELLLSQISNSGAENISAWKAVLINFSSVARIASRPVFSLGVFILLLLFGSFFGRSLFLNAKPNDSLYIAKIISEKLKVNTTFNTQERDKLALQFATEHAQAITSVLSDPTFNNEANKDQVAKLNDNFKEEVATVQNKFDKLDASKKMTRPGTANPKLNSDFTLIDDNVVIADSARDKQGIQLIDSAASQIKAEEVLESTKASSALSSLAAKEAKINLASSTGNIASSSESAPEVNKNGASQILDEAQKLFDQKDYSQASKKLKEVEEIIK
ncbi:MAG: hypothetical protein WC863_02075 [Patescibacteria group bacterium]